MGSAVIDALSESGGEECEYESDSDGTNALAMRRRAASDDEEDEGGSQRRDQVGATEGVHHQDAASSVDDEGSRLPYSDDEEADDIEGAPPLYEEEEEEEELLEEEDQEQQGQLLRRRRRKGSDEEEEEEEDEAARVDDVEEGGVGGSKQGKSPARAEAGTGPATTDGKEVNEEEKKEAEPFVVPTAGAFYMHDDRFRDNGGARPRRSMAGRKLWEAKDEKLWVHDLFEEMNLQHERTPEGYHKGGRGRGRGRGRVRGRDRGGRTNSQEDVGGMRLQPTGRGRVSKAETSDSSAGATNYAPKTSQEATPTNATDAEVSGQSNRQPDNAVTKKVSSGSYLNSASPPFIPSGALQQKLSSKVDSSSESGVPVAAGRVQTKGREQYGSGSAGSASKARVGTEKTVAPKSQGGQGRGSVPQSAAYTPWNQGDAPPSVYQHVTKSAPAGPGLQQNADAKAQRNHDVNRPVGGPVPAQQSARGVALQDQATSFSRSPQNQGQPQQVEGQPSVSRSSPLPSPSNHVQASNNTRYKSSGGGRGTRMGNMGVGGRGSYVFAGASIGGAGTGLQVGEPGFQPTPAVGAVPYGAQAPAGIGVPAVGLPIPNYPYGFPNSEVTWVPVLAGGGTIGGAYGAPYIALEGAPSHMYYTQPSAQPVPYHLPGRDMNGAKPPGGLWKPPPSPELGTDEFEQRQSKPRRYSEMNFGH